MVALIGKREPIQFGSTTRGNDTSIGDAFTMLAKPFLDTLTPAIKRQSLFDAERKAAGVEGVAAAIEAARATGGKVDPYSIFASGARGGLTGNNVGDFVLGVTGNARGAQDRATTDAAVASGKNYGGTYHGTQDQLQNARTLQSMQEATKLRVAAQQPQTVLVDGVPTIVRQDQSYGQPASVGKSEQEGALLRGNWNNLPALNEQQQTALKVNPGADELVNAQLQDGSTVPARARMDGLYDVNTGQKIPNVVSVGKLVAQSAEGLGGSTLTNKIVERRVARDQAVSAIDRLDAKLAAPNADQAVGWIGRGANIFNDVRAQVEAATRLKGGMTAAQEVTTNPQINAALDNVFRDPGFVETAQRLGVQNAVLRANIVDLAYTIAKSKDPGGRMSDQDINRAAEIVGASLMDPNAARQVLGELKNSVIQDHDIWEQNYGAVRGGAGAAARPQAPAAQQPAAPAAVERWERGPDGRLQRVQ
jgi:hypothetical protein